MKKLLLATTLILAASLPSKADQLPSIYLGQWCDAGDGTFEWPATEDERQVCVDASKGLMIRHGGMDGHLSYIKGGIINFESKRRR